MQTFLITGSNGLLGQKLIYALLKRKDIRLIATSRGENRLLKKEGYTYVDLDITQQTAVEATIKQYQPHCIINTAALTNVDACETQREACWDINVKAVSYFTEAIKKHSTTNCHFIHLSTDFVFDGEAGPYREEDQPNPLSYYALSKYESEKVVRASGIKWAIARTIIVYGIVDNMSRSNVVLWAKEALEKGQEIKVVDDQYRSPTLAEDLAAGCILIADKEETGIYHLSGKNIMSILELVTTVADFWKLDKTLIKPIHSNTLNQAAKRPPRTGFILDKAYHDLNYQPHSFVEGLEVLRGQLN